MEIPRLPLKGLEDKVTGAVGAEWLIHDSASKDAPVCVFYHGGAYTQRRPPGHRPITALLATRGIKVLSVDYRLAPEDPFPAALTDAITVYRHVLSSGVPSSRIFMSGDSAGGGLTYGALLWTRDNNEGVPMPAGVIPIAPWVDVIGFSPTLHLADEFENDMLARGFPGKEYFHTDPDGLMKNILVSPLYDEVKPNKKLPPQMVVIATVDRLYAENLAIVLKRIAGGEAITVDLNEDQVHVFQILSWLPQSVTCLDRMADFMKSISTSPSTSPYSRTSSNWITMDGKVHASTVTALRDRLKSLVERRDRMDADKLAAYVGAAKL